VPASQLEVAGGDLREYRPKEILAILLTEEFCTHGAVAHSYQSVVESKP